MTQTSFDIQSIANRHGFSSDAVLDAWNALRHGGGSMAQFSHPELGGSGQWIPGMIMIGDMFNNSLKARVENLFNDLSNLPVEAAAPPQSAQQNRAAHRASSEVSLSYGSSGFTADSWYPRDLGSPSTTGAQNSVRYAYFPGTSRLAIELFGKVTIYDTGSHYISGVSQSQSNDAGSITFTSQFGVLPVLTLRVVG